ncbi:MAG: hypothetical protein AAF414_17915 [Pseudomonadota bacterium]
MSDLKKTPDLVALTIDARRQRGHVLRNAIQNLRTKLGHDTHRR